MTREECDLRQPSMNASGRAGGRNSASQNKHIEFMGKKKAGDKREPEVTPVVDEVDSKSTGRPTLLTPELADLICSLLAEGQSLVKICRGVEGLPHVSTVFDWLAKGTGEDTHEPYKAFADKCAQAREAQAEFYASEIIDIADGAHDDEVFTDEGKRVCNIEFVQRSKLRVSGTALLFSPLRPTRFRRRTGSDCTLPSVLVGSRCFPSRLANQQPSRQPYL